jgi:GNAT superfamily N-acetyltransferase
VIVRVARLDEILSLRHAVLRPGRPLSSAAFEGDGEATTVHVAAAFEDCARGEGDGGRRAALAAPRAHDAPTPTHRSGALEVAATPVALTPRVVGCATVMRRALGSADAAQLRGMATAPAHARRGIGTAVLRFVEELVATDWRLPLAWCNARTSAVGFYEHAGWQVVSDEFDVPDVGPHVKMTRHLRVP